jgi:hypothetical protein
MAQADRDDPGETPNLTEASADEFLEWIDVHE